MNAQTIVPSTERNSEDFNAASNSVENRASALAQNLLQHYDTADIDVALVMAIEEIRHACDLFGVDFYTVSESARSFYAREVFA